MIGPISTLFVTPKAITARIDAAADGLQKLAGSTEDNDKYRALAQAEVIEWLTKASGGQHLTRRLIALVVIGVWSTCIVAGLLLTVATPFVDDATPYNAAASTLFDLVKELALLVFSVVAFYFGAERIQGIAAAIRGK